MGPGVILSFAPIQRLRCHLITCTNKIVKSAKTNSGSNNGIDCTICLEDFKYGDKCSHGFHKTYIDKWLTRDDTVRFVMD